MHKCGFQCQRLGGCHLLPIPPVRNSKLYKVLFSKVHHSPANLFLHRIVIREGLSSYVSSDVIVVARVVHLEDVVIIDIITQARPCRVEGGGSPSGPRPGPPAGRPSPCPRYVLHAPQRATIHALDRLNADFLSRLGHRGDIRGSQLGLCVIWSCFEVF